MNKENPSLCMVFPMGLEAYPFLNRVEVTGRRMVGRAVYRDAYFEGSTIGIIRCGVGPQRAAAAMRNISAAPEAIVCVGTAGALVEDLRLGDITVSVETVLGTGVEAVMKCSDGLVEALVRASRSEGNSPRVVRLATVHSAVSSREDRKSLHEMTGAHAVDMESHAVAVEAARLGVPFACLRVISDDFRTRSRLERPAAVGPWKRPFQIPGWLASRYRWWALERDFRRVVESLHPVLVRLMRDRAIARHRPTRVNG